MAEWERILVGPDYKIIDAIKLIDISSLQIALVVDENKKLLGTVTDGDIRRGILKGVSLEQPVADIMKENSITINFNTPIDEIIKIMKEEVIHQLPIVDENGHVIGLEILNDLLEVKSIDNWVVLMAGGLGTRLSPLTDECPKPMVKVGGKPVLETILDGFKEQGFKHFYLAVNHLKSQITEYFGDGSARGVVINYLHENKKMGTAGALSLLDNKPNQPIIVMNGDLLTKVNYRHLLEYHCNHQAMATMCVREYAMQIPYGVVKINNQSIIEIDEKPLQKFFVNAGIYVLDPDVLKLIPQNDRYDMTILFEELVNQGYETKVFPIREYWIDIGHNSDFKKANDDFSFVFLDDKDR
jgi:dTDP-glucose pyrophosphorylase